MIRSFIAAIALIATTAAAQPAAPAAPVTNPQTPAAIAWGYAVSDLPADPDVRFGLLPNGMKYALQRNTTPRGTIAMRLHFDIGSFAEAEDQRGLAHFLEHMAFNGSTHVPEGEMVRLLERNGLAFGADTNASTGFDATTYQLDLPQNTPALIDTGVMLLREIASELTIAPEAVERERGVILSERRARDTYALRNLMGQLSFLLSGSLVPDRLPIGTEEVIRTAPASRIADFYQRWYQPERATLVIVGDFDVDAMEADIQRRFGSWSARAAAAPDPSAGAIDLARPRAADLFVHPAIGETVVVTWFKPWALEADTRDQRRIRTLEAIGDAIVERRLSRIALMPDAPFTAASFSEGGTFDMATSMSLSASTRDGAWQPALAAIENELRRAREHGFTDAEVAEQIAINRTAIRNEVAGVATRRSGALAARLLAVADGRSVVTTPAFRAALFEEFVPGITADSVTAAFRALTDGFGAPLVRVTSKTDVAGGRDAVLAAFDSATRVAVLPPAARAEQAFAYTDFGTPGTVVSDDRIDDLGIRRIRFANNVMLNIKRTDFEDDRVRMQVRIDGGALLNTRDDPTRVALAALVPLGGLEAHSVDELRSITAGRTVGSSFSAATDSFNLSAVTTPTDLLLQAQLFAAYLTAPGYRPEALDLFRRVLPQQYAASDATPAAVLGRDVGAIIADGDPRLVQQPLEVMLALDWPSYRTAVADSVENGAIEIGIVGAVDEDTAIAAIAATFGALPERRATFDPREEARVRSFASDRTTRILRHKGEADQAIVQTYWQARDDADLGEAMRIELLSQVMGIMLIDELRERLGQTYSPSAGASLSSDYPGFGYLVASSTVAVGDIAAVDAAIDAIATELRTTPVSDDILNRARNPLIERLTQSRRENAYWLPYVANASSDPARLDRSRGAIAEVRGTTAAELQTLAQRYLVAERALKVRAVPEWWSAP